MQHYALADLIDDRPVLLDSDVVHAVKVMRMRVGDLFVGIWNGRRTVCQITSISPFDSVCTNEQLPSNEPRLFVTALLAITKANALEIAVQKCVEAGAGSVVLLVAHRSPPGNVNLVRLQRIAKEAAEQAHRDFVPVVSGPVGLDAFLAEPSLPGFVFDVAATISLSQTKEPLANSACLAIGPEGGWQKAELDRFQKAGFMVRSLSKTVLRAETAAAVATYELCWNLASKPN